MTRPLKLDTVTDPPRVQRLVDGDGTDLPGALDVVGNTTLGGTLGVTGLATMSAGAAVTGNIAVSGTVDGVDIATRDATLSSHIADTDPHSGALPRSGARAMTGALDMGAQAITNVGNVDGRDVSVDGAKLDGIAAGAAAVSSSTPADVAASGAAGVGTSAARSDHVHAHGTQLGGSLHANATVTTAGFMSASDKLAVASISELQEILRAVGVDAPEDDTAPEILWQFGNSRWGCGGSTSGFDQPFFYCENQGDFGSGGDCELYSPIGVPNGTSQANNWPIPTDDKSGASMYWDEGIPLDGGKLVNGAHIEIDLFGFLKVGRTGFLYITLDPDSDSRFRYSGNNVNASQERVSAIGLVANSSPGTLGTVVDNGSGKIRINLVDHGLGDDERVWLRSYDEDLDDDSSGIASDIDTNIRYYVLYIDDDNFDISETAVASPTYVDYNLDPSESDKVLVITGAGAGSWKRAKLSFTLTTLTPETTDDDVAFDNDWQPCKIKIIGVSSGGGTADNEYGLIWYGTLERHQMCDQIGPTNDPFNATENGTPTVRASCNRTHPGTGLHEGTTIQPATAAPLLLAKSNYDSLGAGNEAYYHTAFDFGGNWDEVELDAELTNTGSYPYKSILPSFADATITLLKVGGVYVGQVVEVLNKRLVIRYRPFSAATRIEYGDTVDWELYRKVSGSYGTAFRTGSFTAGTVRLGPQRLNISVRCAMQGVQDATNRLDIHSGRAVLYRHRST